jgi:hypothetical protein
MRRLLRPGVLPVWRIMVGAFLLLVTLGSMRACAEEQAARRSAERRAEQLIVLNDSTQARLTRSESSRKELLALKDAARTLDGKLVAGVRLVVRPDTVYVPIREVETVWLEDSTRVATLRDSTEGYYVTVTGKAPPTGPLELGYEIITPEFTPQVGFVRRGSDYYAVVSWAGKRVETSEAFFRPERPRRLNLVVGGTLRSPLLALDARDLNLSAHAGVQYRLPNNVLTQLQAGVGPAPFVGLRVEKVW